MSVIIGFDAVNDSLTGTGAADTISGLGGDDTLIGSGGGDSLLGGNGLDLLNGGASADTMVGGDGNDIYIVNDAGDLVSELSNKGTDLVQSTISYTVTGNVEQLLLTGAGAINGTGNSQNNLITGNNANNVLDGKTGADTMVGLDGNDTYIVNDAGDVVSEAANRGTDLVQSSVGYTLAQNVEQLTLIGTADIDGTGSNQANVLLGNKGINSLNGGAGNDTMAGGLGNDIYVVNAAGDVVSEDAGKGNDLVKSSVSYTLGANLEKLTLIGAGNIDGTGNEKNNTVTGNAHDNVLDGGLGADRLVGGGGNDTLYYDSDDTLLDGGGGTDTLMASSSPELFNLNGLPGVILKSLEAIDLQGHGISLQLTASQLLALSGSSTLRVMGNGDDAVLAAGVWSNEGSVVIDTVNYTEYHHGDAVLQVQNGIGTSILVGPVSSIELSTLYGGNGFRMHGNYSGDHHGGSVAGAGDVNGDGLDDIISGSPGGNPGGQTDAGESYVVFGSATGWSSNFNASDLDGTAGYRLEGGAAGDQSGIAVGTAGDVNGDGLADIVIGANKADPSAGTGAGSSYVVFGSETPGASVELSGLVGTDGFRLDGYAPSDQSGQSVNTAGDVNGDGYDDVIVGAPYADPGGRTDAGQSYVVFGKASGFSASFGGGDVQGAVGFRLDGIDSFYGGTSGYSVASAGDVNGDGFDDLIVGAPYMEDFEGESYVVFGKASGFGSFIDLGSLNGSNGFSLGGLFDNKHSGFSVAAAGDINGDGYGDVIVGAPSGHGGASYLVFGKAGGFSSFIDLDSLNGTSGFSIIAADHGSGSADESGYSVGSAGDVNGDGYDDLIIGAPGANPAGESYVVYGKASGLGSVIDLSTLGASSGFRIDGISSGDQSGSSVGAAGDVNGDGYGDLIVGAPSAYSGAGETYVVLGDNFNGAAQFAGGEGNDSLAGTAAAEAFVGGLGNDTLAGAGGADAFHGGAGDDVIGVSDASFLRVDGGSGSDTLRLDGTSTALDLTAIPTETIRGIEKVDLGDHLNTLTLNLQDLLNLSGSSNQLIVEGGATDSVIVDSGTWTSDGTFDGYQHFSCGAATLLINEAISNWGIPIAF